MDQYVIKCMTKQDVLSLIPMFGDENCQHFAGYFPDKSFTPQWLRIRNNHIEAYGGRTVSGECPYTEGGHLSDLFNIEKEFKSPDEAMRFFGYFRFVDTVTANDIL